MGGAVTCGTGHALCACPSLWAARCTDIRQTPPTGLGCHRPVPPNRLATADNESTAGVKHKTTWTFRQSWVKDFLLCPDRGRRNAFDPAFQAANGSSDATTLGTALHEYAEGRLHQLGHSQAAAEATQWLQLQIDDATFDWILIKTPGTLHGKLVLMMERFRGVMDNIILQYGYPDPNEIERLFDVPLSPDGTIRLAGQWDCRWPNHNRIHDWKTAGSLDRYVGWEIDRWYVQPTVYCVAAAIVDLVDAYDGDEGAAMDFFWSDPDGFETTFEFNVVDKTTSANHQSFETTRNQGHASWLLEQLESFVNTHDLMGTDGPWPKNDQHALCSAKWCPAWDTCKGRHLA